MGRRELKPCGTPAAYRRHLRLRNKLLAKGDTEGANAAAPCEPCLKAHARAVTEAKRKPWEPRTIIACPSNAAYYRHRRRGEYCRRCWKQHSLHNQRYRRRMAAQGAEWALPRSA